MLFETFRLQLCTMATFTAAETATSAEFNQAASSLVLMPSTTMMMHAGPVVATSSLGGLNPLPFDDKVERKRLLAAARQKKKRARDQLVSG
jgi:hypothetical protein